MFCTLKSTKMCFRFSLKCFLPILWHFFHFWTWKIRNEGLKYGKFIIKSAKNILRKNGNTFLQILMYRTRRTKQIIMNLIPLYLFDLWMWKLIKYSRESVGVSFCPNAVTWTFGDKKSIFSHIILFSDGSVWHEVLYKHFLSTWLSPVYYP